MPFTLGAITLPQPKSFTRDFIETGRINLLLEGKTTKRTENRKERFILVFQNLTEAERDSILSEYELETTRSFTVDEDELDIGPTDVLIGVTGMDYPPSGTAYRGNLTLRLTEVI